jgi:iron(III) transport system ATP-binding protein
VTLAASIDTLPAVPTPIAQQPRGFVRVENVRKTFGQHTVLDDVSLEIFRGELLAILGPSGCGKTTLLRIIAGLERQDTGTIVLNDVDVSTAPPAARGCGIVFQSYALFPNLTVAANIAFGMNRRKTSGTQRQAKVQTLLDLIGLPDIAGKHPSKLSGGQQQRVALARALAVEPAILLLDEPLSALDAKVRARLRGEIRQIQQRLGVTTILVTHDQEEALTMADRVVVMDQGRILQIGTPLEIYQNPRHATVGEFVGSINCLPGWTVTAHMQLERFDRIFSCGNLPILPGEALSVTFRPEDAWIVDDSQLHRGNCLPATVQRVEFRGASTRVYLTALQATVLVDLPTHQALPLMNAESRSVWLHLPAEHLRLFRKDGTAV